MGTRYSAIDTEVLTEEDKIACGMLPSQHPSASKDSTLHSLLGTNDEVVDLQ